MLLEALCNIAGYSKSGLKFVTLNSLVKYHNPVVY